MIKFLEDGHKYEGVDGSTDWTSATRLIHYYEPEKNWERIAARFAKKHGRTTEDVLLEWKTKNERAISRGNKFHVEREREISGCEEINGLKIHRSNFDPEGWKLAPVQRLEDGIYPELMVYLTSAKLCGQSDITEIKNGYINISDYKTNEELKKRAYIDWDGVEECMLAPLATIPNCNFWHYVLQLNLYAYIVRKNNPWLKVGELKILHIRFDESDEVIEVVPHLVPNKQDLVHKWVEHFKVHKGHQPKVKPIVYGRRR